MTPTAQQITSELVLLQRTIDSQAERIRCLENLVDHLPLPETTTRLMKSPPIDVPVGCDDAIHQVSYLFNVPDVVVLMNGDAVAKDGWPDLSPADRRDSLAYSLARVCAGSNAAAQVVFDGNFSGVCPPSLYHANVEVRLSNQPLTADQAVHELVQTYPKKSPLVLVSNNEALRVVSAGRVNFVDTYDLLDLFLLSTPLH